MSTEHLAEYTRTLDCVHCGLCIPHCPTHEVTGREADSPRGRVHLIRGFAEGRFELSENAELHLDQCIVCRACESACPSGVRMGEIMELFREHRRRGASGTVLGRFLLRELLPHRWRIALVSDALEIYQRSGLRSLGQRALDALGHTRYLVEIGGELRARGAHLDGEPWRVAIEAPDAIGRRIHRIVELRDLAMATSGDYRNYYEQDGVRISHTIDPRDGRPIRHNLASVTVLHLETLWADAWATALNVLGPEEGLAVADENEIAAYFIVREKDGTFSTRESRVFEAFKANLPPEPTDEKP